MERVERLIEAANRGDRQAAEALLPLVYDELRTLAAQRLARESPGQTLQPTALVHEAYLRLVGGDSPAGWDGRGHFFAAAAEAMRRILINRARDKQRLKRGGARARIPLDLDGLMGSEPDIDLIALDEAMHDLEQVDPESARLVALRFFAGLTQQEASQALGISPRTAARDWAFARAWLFERLNPNAPDAWNDHDMGESEKNDSSLA
jgi:RNA polymerase sigma factor (TIGR02999 family)